MRASGRKTDKHIAFCDCLSRNHLALFADAYAKARQIVLSLVIKARHFRSLAAQKRATRVHAAVGNTFDQLTGNLCVQFATGNVIQEEQRLYAGAENVVHAHRNAVNTHGVVFFQLERDVKFCSHAVSAAYHDRLFVAFGNLKHTVKTAQFRQKPRNRRAFCVNLVFVYGVVAFLYVNA